MSYPGHKQVLLTILALYNCNIYRPDFRGLSFCGGGKWAGVQWTFIVASWEKQGCYCQGKASVNLDFVHV